MIETSSEQINDENHDYDQDHNHNTSKKLKEYENRETGKYVYFRKVDIYIFLYTCLFSLSRSEVENISPMPFVYTKWKNFNDLYYFQKL